MEGMLVKVGFVLCLEFLQEDQGDILDKRDGEFEVVEGGKCSEFLENYKQFNLDECEGLEEVGKEWFIRV